MIEVYERVFIGDEHNCRHGSGDWAVVHACKSPCHQRAVGYKGSLPNTHQYYLVYEDGQNLFLNIIDPPGPLFMPPLFHSFLAFAKKYWDEGKKILIHCNQGESRAPSLALLFLSKIVHALPNDSYMSAKNEFIKIYPGYTPGNGIQIYLSKNWDLFGEE